VWRHTVADPLAPVENEQAYAEQVAPAGDRPLLRQTFPHRAGHCTFSPAEKVAALQTLVDRVEHGTWPSTAPKATNARALAWAPSSTPTSTTRPASPCRHRRRSLVLRRGDGDPAGDVWMGLQPSLGVGAARHDRQALGLGGVHGGCDEPAAEAAPTELLGYLGVHEDEAIAVALVEQLGDVAVDVDLEARP
jgi:hypothetical protein